VSLPRGSVLVSLLYEIPALLSNYSSAGHLYAVDQPLFMASACPFALTNRIDALSRQLHCWVSSNHLNILNSSKTQLN